MAERTADIERGRDAARREAWAEAYEELTTAAPSDLTPEDLEALSDAAWWLSRMDEAIAARQQAYAAFAASGDQLRAASNAGRLSVEHFLREEPAVGAGWLMRAQRHLDGQSECIEQGFLALLEATVARFTGDLDGAMALAKRATAIALRLDNRDLWAMGIHTEGLLLIARGDIADGLARLDEAMTSVVAGELSSFFTGIVYCNVIAACLELADLRRAHEWSEASRAWCETLPPESPYPGMCRINRAEVSSLRGAWSEAEAESSRASRELMSFDPMAAAQAFYGTGEIRRRMGNLAGAEESFARAHEIGFEPQPGLALLRLAQGKTEAARTGLRAALAGEMGGRMRRARLLGAQVDVALAEGDVETARTASAELDSIAAGYATPALDASAATARGAIRLAEGDAPAALESLRHAVALWQEIRLPYEVAVARTRYATALRSAADEDDAALELRAAIAAFERLGAVTDARTAKELLAGPAGLPRGLTAREAEVLRLVAAGRSNREIATTLVISEHTVARHLQNMFAKLGVSSRSGATAFAFEHGLN
ncbi:MAG: LuxR C-terminal-related transcriptional regulator [Actinomycetota bacterium]